MEEHDQEDKAARECFKNPERPVQSWTRALFRTNTKCDMLLNNLCESFNRGPRVSVDGLGGVNIVDMKAKSCTCRRWELTGLPCPHAYACISGNSERVEDYVDTFYTIETFKNVYSHYINPTNPKDHWPEVVDCGEVIPPKIVKKKRGRKPKSRKKPEELEKKKKVEAVGKAEKRAE
ncbi:hypothetical protein AABB24_002889 [Solanum stoloniferum]